MTIERGFAGGAVELAQCVGDVTGFIRAGFFARDRNERAIRLNRFDIVAQH